MSTLEAAPVRALFHNMAPGKQRFDFLFVKYDILCFFLPFVFTCKSTSNKTDFFFQAPEGETQPSTEVDLFISTEKIMVLNTDLKVRLGELVGANWQIWTETETN